MDDSARPRVRFARALYRASPTEADTKLKFTRRELLLGAAGIVGATAAEAQASHDNFVIEEVEVFVPGLDAAHDGLRVAQLSDLHVGAHTPDGRLLSAVRKINAQGAELVVLTGDFVTTRRDPVERIPDLLAGFSMPAVAVLGNHDHWAGAERVRKAVERADIAVLQNTHTTLQLRGEPFRVLGIDDGRTRNDDAPATFRGVPDQGSRLVLAHTPATADRLPEEAGVLCLSGHTHGGHVMIPGITKMALRISGQPYSRGHYTLGRNQLYVNRGIGMDTPVPRVGADAELTFLTLRRAET